MTSENNVLNIANGYHHTIKLAITSQGRSNVAFLDVELSLCSDNSIFFELYRKPANTYQYLPRSSCHRAQTFNGLVVGESIRILRRCLRGSDATKHLAFLSESYCFAVIALGTSIAACALQESGIKASTSNHAAE